MKDSIDVYSTPKVLTAATESNSSLIQVDLTTRSWTELNIQCTLYNDAPAPFNSRGIFLNYAFSDVLLTLSEAPTLLDKSKKVFTVLTNNTENSIKAFNSGSIRILGDYFYMWVNHGDLGNTLTFTASLIDVSTGTGGGNGGSSTATEATQLNVLTQATNITNKVATQITLNAVSNTLATMNANLSKDSTVQSSNSRLGNITDAAITDPLIAGSIVALLKGLIRITSDAWDPNTHTLRSYLVTKLDPVNDSVSIHNGTTAQEATTSVVSAAVSTTLIAANTLRKGLTIYNDANQPMYIKHGSGASTSSFKLKLAAGGFYVMPVPVYTGIITAIWASSPTGSAFVSENIL